MPIMEYSASYFMRIKSLILLQIVLPKILV